MSEPIVGSLGHSENLFREIRLRDYLEVARRRKMWLILCTTGVFVAASVMAYRMPNIYRSETVIQVDPAQVPSTYVSSTVSTSVMDRLTTVRQQTLSPSRLQSLAEQLKLYPELQAQGKWDRIVQLIQKSITLDVVDAGGQRLGAFRVAYTSQVPAEAARVANELAATVIDDNLKAREQQFTGTEEFLGSELNDTKRQLEQKEAEMGRIKTQNIMDLPESKQYHLEALSNLRLQLQASQDRIAQDQQQKVYIQSVLASTTPTVDLDALKGGEGASGPRGQIQKLESQLASLKSRYGPGFPEVRKLEAEISQQKARAAQEEKTEAAQEAENKTPQSGAPIAPPVKNPVLEAQLAKLDQDIDEQTRLQPKLQEQIDFHASKLEREPIFEQQIAGLMRDYDTLRAHYNQLLDKKLSADMATQLENRQKGERFVILDEAKVPTHPAGPNRLLFSVAGFLGGLFGGIGLAILAEITDESARTEREVSQLVGKRVLAGIPFIMTNGERRRNLSRAAAAFAVTVVSSAGLGIVLALLGARYL